MTFKLIASTLAISLASVVAASAQDGGAPVEGAAPTPPAGVPTVGLPGTVAGVALPATNLLIVGGVLVATAGVLSGSQDSSDGTNGTSTTGTTGTN